VLFNPCSIGDNPFFIFAYFAPFCLSKRSVDPAIGALWNAKPIPLGRLSQHLNLKDILLQCRQHLTPILCDNHRIFNPYRALTGKDYLRLDRKRHPFF